MIFAWIKQFLVATGLFALFTLGQAMNLALKEIAVAEKQMVEASLTVRTTAGNHHHLN